jgi:hypothetical protein
MAIKVNTTPVITDTGILESITGASGNYGVLQPTISTTTNNINFGTPMMNCVLTANTTFSESGVSQGKTATLLLDTSANFYTPSWSSSITWENGTEPTWGSWRYWQITFIADSASDIRAAAVGFTSTGGGTPPLSISLEGTAANPERFITVPTGNGDMVAGWRFGSDGNVYQYESFNNQGGQGYTLHNTVTWINVPPSTTYYIRASNYSGSFTLSVGDSSSINTWNALTSNNSFRYRDSRNVLTYADEEGYMKIEISTTSNGSNIVATGYYGVRWTGFA